MNIKNKQEEFLDLYEPIAQSLSAFARALEKNEEAAKDLVSESILLAYKNFEKIEDKSAFKSYIFSICSRLHKRKKWRLRFFGEYNEEKSNNIADVNFKPDLNLDVELLYKALDKLPEKQKEAIVLFEISGFSIKEIQALQGGTESAIKSRLKRGREKLKDLLTEKEVKKNNINFNQLSKNNGSVFEHNSKLNLSVNNE